MNKLVIILATFVVLLATFVAINAEPAQAHWGHRRLVIEPRFWDGDQIFLSNRLTGPFSVNRNIVRVNRDIWFDFDRRGDIDNDLDFVITSGGNIISGNTLVGLVRTGRIDLDVDLLNRF